MTIDTLDLAITEEQLARIEQSEAVVVTHYHGPEGRFAQLTFIGSLEEANVAADTPGLVIVPTGVKCDGKMVVPTSELLRPPYKSRERNDDSKTKTNTGRDRT